jgi:1-acyl-sn-glycerol-3-phosphate acyltransferase
MKTKRYGLWYNFIRLICRPFWKKYTVRFESPRIEPAAYISHHQDMHGVFVAGLFFPGVIRIWGYHVFLALKACFRQYAHYTLATRLGWPRWLAVVAAAPLSLIVSTGCRSAKGIPVYRDRRIAETLDISVKALQAGDSIAIFATREYTDAGAEIGDMYSGFLHLEPRHFAATGRHVPFVPLYASKGKRELVVGAPVYFRDGESVRDGKARVMGELQTELNRMARDCGDITR